MALQVLIGMAVGGAALYVGYRRVRAYGEHVRYRQSLERFEQAMKAARAEASDGRIVRVATADDAELVEMIDVATAERAAIEACGFTLLGEIVEDTPGMRPMSIIRVFVDRAGTTVAQLMMHAGAPRDWFFALVTFHVDEVYSTRAEQMLAQPPFHHVQLLAADTPYRTLVEKHRAFADLDGAQRMTALDEVTVAIGRMRARVVEWRAAQPPDELLDADLRGVLGEQYERSGKFWARQLREDLPQATLPKAKLRRH